MIKLKSFILNSFSILFLLSSVIFCPPKRGVTHKLPPKPKPIFQTIALNEQTTYSEPQFFTENTQVISLSPNGPTTLIIDGENLIIVSPGQTLILKNLLVCPKTQNPFFMRNAKLVLDNCKISLMLETSNLNINPKTLKIKGNVTFFGTPETPLITTEIPRAISDHQAEQTTVIEFSFIIPKETEISINPSIKPSDGLFVRGKLLRIT